MQNLAYRLSVREKKNQNQNNRTEQKATLEPLILLFQLTI